MELRLIIAGCPAPGLAISWSNLTNEQVSGFVKQDSVNKAIEDALRAILAQKAVVAELANQKLSRDEEMQEIFDDQERLRENLKALKGSPEEKALVQRYMQQLGRQETQLESLRKELAGLEAKREGAAALLDRMVEQLTFDVKM